MQYQKRHHNLNIIEKIARYGAVLRAGLGKKTAKSPESGHESDQESAVSAVAVRQGKSWQRGTFWVRDRKTGLPHADH